MALDTDGTAPDSNAALPSSSTVACHAVVAQTRGVFRQKSA